MLEKPREIYVESGFQISFLKGQTVKYLSLRYIVKLSRIRCLSDRGNTSLLTLFERYNLLLLIIGVPVLQSINCALDWVT